jgi:hypothetical protein
MDRESPIEAQRLLRVTAKNRDASERILRERGDVLKEEQRRCLLETIRMGEEARCIRMVERERGGAP